MPTDTTINNLIINRLTKAQYDAISSPSETELYLIPDEMDTTPTSGSENAVTSGGVYNALAGKSEPIPVESTTVTSGQIVTIASLTPNVLHKYTGAAIGNLTVSALATPSDATVYNEYMLEVELGASSVISFPASLKWYGGAVPTIEAGVWQFSIVDGCIVAGMFNATS